MNVIMQADPSAETYIHIYARTITFTSNRTHCHSCVPLAPHTYILTIEFTEYYRRVPRYIPPSAPTKKKWPVYERIDVIRNAAACYSLKILLEYQFFTEMLKQVRGSVNECEDTLGPFYFGGGGGGGGG